MRHDRFACLLALLFAALLALAPSLTLADASGGTGPRNMVRAEGQASGHLVVRGNVQINTINSPQVEPVNEAYAHGNCDGCVTLAVALQLDLYNPSATTVSPQNEAFAINEACNGCTTVAVACQVVRPVDDPGTLPSAERDLVQQMNHELTEVQSDPSISLDAAVSQVVAVIHQYEQRTGTPCLQQNRASN